MCVCVYMYMYIYISTTVVTPKKIEESHLSEIEVVSFFCIFVGIMCIAYIFMAVS